MRPSHYRIHVFFFAGLVLLFSTARCQWQTGLCGGISENILQTNSSNFPNQRYHSGKGLFLEIPVSRWWKSGIGIDGGLSFVQKSYSIDTIGEGQTRQSTNDYLHFRLGTGYTRGLGKWVLQASVGGYAGYWTGGRESGSFYYFFSVPNSITVQYSSPYAFDSRRDERWEWGWQAGGSIGYSLGHGLTPQAGVRFFQSLRDQQKKYMIDQVPRYNRTWIFSIGVTKQWGKNS